MFDIAFVSDEPEVQEGGSYALRGEAVIGDLRETFLAPLDLWSRADYERQWVEAAQRVLDAPAAAGFFTAAFQFWWTMWREGSLVLVQQQYIVPEQAAQLTNPRLAPYDLIRERRELSEDGEHVSQWYLDAADIRGFLRRRGG